jgi:hypothetical protein
VDLRIVILNSFILRRRTIAACKIIPLRGWSRRRYRRSQITGVLRIVIQTGYTPRNLRTNWNISHLRIVILRGWSWWRGGRRSQVIRDLGVFMLTVYSPRSLGSNRSTRGLKVVVLTGYIRVARFFLFLVSFGCAGISCRVGLRGYRFGLRCSSIGL